MLSNMLLQPRLKITDFFRYHPSEIQTISIEISVLSKPQKLTYGSTEDLLDQLIPGETGVILKDGRMQSHLSSAGMGAIAR